LFVDGGAISRIAGWINYELYEEKVYLVWGQLGDIQGEYFGKVNQDGSDLFIKFLGGERGGIYNSSKIYNNMMYVARPKIGINGMLKIYKHDLNGENYQVLYDGFVLGGSVDMFYSKNCLQIINDTIYFLVRTNNQQSFTLITMGTNGENYNATILHTNPIGARTGYAARALLYKNRVYFTFSEYTDIFPNDHRGGCYLGSINTDPNNLDLQLKFISEEMDIIYGIRNWFNEINFVIKDDIIYYFYQLEDSNYSTGHLRENIYLSTSDLNGNNLFSSKIIFYEYNSGESLDMRFYTSPFFDVFLFEDKIVFPLMKYGWNWDWQEEEIYFVEHDLSSQQPISYIVRQNEYPIEDIYYTPMDLFLIPSGRYTYNFMGRFSKGTNFNSVWIGYTYLDYHLTHLTITPGELVPKFHPLINSYNAKVSRNTKRVLVNAKNSDPSAVISINDKLTRSGVGVYIPIEQAQTLIQVKRVVEEEEEGG
jgi:hypothetical protein